MISDMRSAVPIIIIGIVAWTIALIFAIIVNAVAKWTIALIFAIIVNAVAKIVLTCVLGILLGLIGIRYTKRRANREEK
ncbi:MAG: hypothetical protein RL421_1045 [Actinomycetota bacterium]